MFMIERRSRTSNAIFSLSKKLATSSFSTKVLAFGVDVSNVIASFGCAFRSRDADEIHHRHGRDTALKSQIGDTLSLRSGGALLEQTS